MPKSPSFLSPYLFTMSIRVLNLGTSHSQKHLSIYSPAHSSQRHFSPWSRVRSTQDAFSTWALCSPLPPAKFKTPTGIVQLQAVARCRSWDSPSCRSWDAAMTSLSSPPIPFLQTVVLIITTLQPLEKSHITTFIQW